MQLYEIQFVVLSNGKSPFIEWLNSLDGTIRKRINQRILRIEDGNFGDCKKLTDEISELRFAFGKGYRVYFAQFENTVVLLINGGDKSSQSKDIKVAQKLLFEWRQNK